MRGIIDRFVDSNWAVLLVGDEEREYNVRLEMLPINAKEGSMIEVEIQDGEVKNIVLLLEETTREQERIKSKMDLLRSRKKSNFKR